jgi:hypothetical protein
MKICSITDCTNKYYSKGFCKYHYDKNRNNGDPNFTRKIEKGTPCSIEGCGKPIWCNHLCAMHDRRLRRHGNPNFINPKCNRDGHYTQRARAKTAQWKKDNKETYNAYLASRKSRVKAATPAGADLAAIREFYFNCPSGYHVDHIVPLNGKEVCGLHTMDNLQYLLAKENLKKSNKVK